MQTDDAAVAPSSALEAASEFCIQRLMHHDTEPTHPTALLAEVFET